MASVIKKFLPDNSTFFKLSGLLIVIINGYGAKLDIGAIMPTEIWVISPAGSGLQPEP